MPRRRRVAFENFGQVLGLPWNDPLVKRTARHAFGNYFKMFADFMLMDTLTPEQIRRMVRPQGRERIDRALAEGKGVVVVTAHVSNWDILAAASAVYGYPISAVTNDLPSGGLNELVIASRERIGMKMIGLAPGSLRQIIKALGRNELVALASDLYSGARGVRVRFFNRPAMFPSGPAALPLKPGPQLRKLAWRNWLNYTKAWIDFFKIPRMDRRKLGALLTPSGLENLDAAMARGKGVIVVAPHMGSWELAAASWAASFGEIGVMVEQIEPRQLFEHVSALRSRMNIRVIPLSRTGARDILRILKEHRMVVLAMDRDILNTGQPFKFFGRLTSFPTGPVEIALKTGAPILPAFCIPDRNDAYIAIGEPPLFLTPSEEHRAHLRGAMEQILATFERYIKRYRDQWHDLEPIWPEKPVVPAVTIPSPPAQAAVGD